MRVTVRLVPLFPHLRNGSLTPACGFCRHVTAPQLLLLRFLLLQNPGRAGAEEALLWGWPLPAPLCLVPSPLCTLVFSLQGLAPFRSRGKVYSDDNYGNDGGDEDNMNVNSVYR